MQRHSPLLVGAVIPENDGFIGRACHEEIAVGAAAEAVDSALVVLALVVTWGKYRRL